MKRNPFRSAARAWRRIVLLLTPAMMSIINAAPAWAGTGATAAILWIGVTDSAHVPLGSYGLSLNNGSLTDPAAAPPALSMHWFYSLFLGIIATPIWLVNNVLSFKWLKVISQPFDFIGHQLTVMVHNPVVLTAIGLIAAAIIAVTFALGKVGKAAAQITTAILLAYISIALANKPVSELLGPNGALTMGRDIGVEISSELSGKPLEGQQAVDSLSQSLADHFARTPTLIWNFGQDLDAPPYNCGQAWSTAITSGPVDKVKDAVAQNCPNGQDLHDYAMSDPTSRKIIAFVAIIFALAVAIVFTYLCVQVVILALSAVFWAIVGIVALITGWIPGGSQNLALKAALDAVFSFAGMTGMVAIVGLTGTLAGAMFSAAGGDLVVAMPLVSLMLVAIFIALRKVRKGILKARERTVRALQRFNGSQGEISGATNILERLDPLTAIPNATHRVTSLARHGATTAAKLGIAAAAPEAAPFLGAADQLQNRASIKNLRGSRRSKSDTSHQKTDTPPQETPAATELQTPAWDADTIEVGDRIRYSGGWDVVAKVNDKSVRLVDLDDRLPFDQIDEVTTSGGAAVRVVTGQRSIVDQVTAAGAHNGYSQSGAPAPPVNSGQAPVAPTLAGPPEPTLPHAASVAEHRQRFPHLCGAQTTRGGYCINAADSCPHHSHAPTPIHPAIAALARSSQDAPKIDDPDAMPEFYADIRAELMGRR
ncbi:MAG: hypothetical protein JST91_12830 [Actinobacteria bacterium]|nr:hypothetical protein [Actinomycetota bacterium]